MQIDYEVYGDLNMILGSSIVYLLQDHIFELTLGIQVYK